MNSEILEKHGLSPLEWVALTGPRTEYFAALNEVALYAVRIDDLPASRSPREIPTADTYREALLGLIKRGWLTVATESPKIRAARLEARGILFPPLDQRAGEGTIDFTSYGYHQCQKILKDLRGSQEPQTTAWSDEAALTLTFISQTKQACQSWVKEEILNPTQGGVSQWFYAPVCTVSIGEPERLGKWKLREAGRTHSHGWRTIVHVKRVRRRRFSLPDWQAEGWITPLERVCIEGKVQGIQFRFFECAESPSWEDSTPIYQAHLTIRDGKSLPGRRVFTTLNGVKTLAYIAGRYRDTHFEWNETQTPTRTEPFTVPEALTCLQEGFSAWKSARANKLGA